MAVGMGVVDEETPLLMLPGHGGHGGASVLRTAGNIFISIVGAGVLGLPYTFRVAGWAVAASCVVGAALLTYYCMLLLVSFFNCETNFFLLLVSQLSVASFFDAIFVAFLR